MSAPARTLTVRVELPLTADSDVSDPSAVTEDLRRLWIVEQVRLRRMGIGKAAELLGMPRAAFMATLGEHGIPVIDYDPSELSDEALGPAAAE